MIAADYNYGQITSKWITKYTREGGGEVLSVDFFPLDVTGFGPVISKIQAAKPDVVISALVGGAHVSFYRQWAASGTKSQIPSPRRRLAAATRPCCCRPPRETASSRPSAISRKSIIPRTRRSWSKFHASLGDKAPYLGAELAMRTYIGFNLWAEGVKRAKSIDRMKVIEALESGISMDTPAGKTVLDPKTHHTTVDVFLAEVSNHGFKLLETFPQQPPLDTASVCDLKAHPDENKQYVVDVKI